MASWVKRERSLADENPSPRKKSRVNYDAHSLVGTYLPPITNHRVLLNPVDCDLGLRNYREMGKQVPAEAVSEMIANFDMPKRKDMPGTDEYFDQVVYIEANESESKRCLNEMKAKLQSGGICRDDLNHRRSYSGYSFNPTNINHSTPHSSTPNYDGYQCRSRFY